MKMRVLFLIVFLVGHTAFGQKITISGYVQDIHTGERIIGAYVIDSLSHEVTATNNYGFFVMKLNKAPVSLQASYVGQHSQKHGFNPTRDTLLVLKIDPMATLSEVVVTSSGYSQVVNRPLGLAVIPIKTLLSTPSLGEPDVLKSIQSQPGIKGGIEGSSGIFVRGGGAGENLFMLDEVPVYNVSHLYGFFSAFNSSAVKDIKLVKGCFPARYGGRTSAVIDVRSRDGNNSRLHGEASIGLISSRLMIDGPLFSDKTTFMLSGRRSYFDVFTEPLKSKGFINESFPNYYFYDLNARLAHQFSVKDKVYLSFYSGSDAIENTNKNSQEGNETYLETEKRLETSGWGNLIGSLRWNHAFGQNLFANTTLAYTNYNYFTEDSYIKTEQNFVTNQSFSKVYKAEYQSRITDLILKTDMDVLVTNQHKVKFGGGVTLHTFNPGKNQTMIDDDSMDIESDSSFTNKVIKAWEPFVYLEDDWTFFGMLTVNPGLRLSGFITDSQSHVRLEPRISVNYQPTDYFSAKLGYSKMVQYIHLLNSSGLSMPTDIWVPSSNGVQPLESDQVNAGVTYMYNRKWFFTAEVYYKWLYQTTDIANGISLVSDLIPWYQKTTQGTGSSRGLELMLEKPEGKLTGTISYTLSKSDRTYAGLNKGKTFPFKFDRVHDLSISVNYQLNNKWDVSAKWVLGSGYPVTMAVEKYLPALGIYNIDTEYGGEITYFPSRYNFRLPAYHRLDLGVHRTAKNRWGTGIWSFDVFNAYNRNNPVNMTFNQYHPENIDYVYLLPIIPTFSYTLRF